MTKTTLGDRMESYGVSIVSTPKMANHLPEIFISKAANTYTPNQGMKTAAKRALRWKEEGKAKGAGTPIGWGRATDIVNNRAMSLDTVKRMYSFFSRHEVDKKGKDFDNISDPSNGRIMWDAWGGDAGFTWSKTIVEREKKKLEKHLAGKHDQTSHGRKGVIKSGFENWNRHIPRLLEASEKIDSTRGQGVQAVIIEAAGFNDKPKILSQAEFDAISGETLYRGVADQSMITDYKESFVQYAGMGTYGNGTYSTTDILTATSYASDFRAQNDGSYKASIMQLKLMPDAKVMTFENTTQLRNWQDKVSSEFLGQFEASTSNPYERQQAAWHLTGTADSTNLAIMLGVDAITFPPYDATFLKNTPALVTEKFTIILNRGKVALNGDA